MTPRKTLRPIKTRIHASKAGGKTLPWHVEMMPIDQIKPADRNARTHPGRQLRLLADSMASFGAINPVIVDEHGRLVAGEARRKAAELLRLTHIPAIRLSHLSSTELRAYALADNKLAEMAGWDRPLLVLEIEELSKELPEIGLDIRITGFEAAEIDSLLGDLSDPELDPADEIPSLAQQPVSTPGDVWELGPHRLQCGDARDCAGFEELMDSELATMVITDPPYNVRIKSVQGRGRRKHREFAHASGELSPKQFTEFLSQPMSLAARHSVEGSIHFWFMVWKRASEILQAGARIYPDLKNIIVWVKTNAGQGTFYRSQHELIFVFKNGDAPHINNFELGQHGRNRSNVWTYAGVNTFRAGRLDDLSVHPTVKPVALVADAMRDCSRRGDIVLDPFMGSGTTILAAERVGRRGYGVELDPLYVDVAVRRWQQFTKRDAVLKGTGQTFDELTCRRGRSP